MLQRTACLSRQKTSPILCRTSLVSSLIHSADCSEKSEQIWYQSCSIPFTVFTRSEPVPLIQGLQLHTRLRRASAWYSCMLLNASYWLMCQVATSLRRLHRMQHPL